MKHLLALDQGTTSSRAIVFSEEGRVAGMSQKEFSQHFPQPGWVEHDPEEIWRTQLEVAREAVERAGLQTVDLAGIGITNQRETTVVWDRRTGQPLHHALVWQDRRTAGFCEDLKKQGLEDKIREKTGLVIDAYFSASKIRWILDHVEGARERAAQGELAFGTIDSWLIWKLTGGRVHATDLTNASRTMLCGLRSGQWDDELLALFDIPKAMMPEIRSSSGLFGEADFGSGGVAIPITGVAGDQHAALFGQCCFEPGMTKNTYGTGCFLLMQTGSEPKLSHHKLVTTVAWKLGDEVEYALEGSIFIGGAVVQWLRDGLGVIRSSEEVEKLARSVDNHGGVYLVPAFAGLGAPHWDARARGLAVGLTRGTTAGHLARAALEAIVFQCLDVMDAMRSDAGRETREMRVDGGASVNDLLMQFQADMAGVEVVRPAVAETTALGAAFLAGLAAEVWPDRQALASLWREERRFHPRMEEAERESRRNQWRRAVERARGWAEEEES